MLVCVVPDLSPFNPRGINQPVHLKATQLLLLFHPPSVLSACPTETPLSSMLSNPDKPNRINTLWLPCIYAPVIAFPLGGGGLGISDCFYDHMVTPSLSLSIHDVQKTFTFCSFPTPKVSPVLSQMLCKIQQAFITPGMFR